METVNLGERIQVAISAGLIIEQLTGKQKAKRVAAYGSAAVGAALAAPEAGAAVLRARGDKAIEKLGDQEGDHPSVVDRAKANIRKPGGVESAKKQFTKNREALEKDTSVKSSAEYNLTKKAISSHEKAEKLEKLSPVRALSKYVKSKTGKAEKPEETNFIKGLLDKGKKFITGEEAS